MQRAGTLLLLLAAPLLSGCAMCLGVDDENYAAYGGIWPRDDMRHGRVGSAFAPQLTGATGAPVADAESVELFFPGGDLAPHE